MQHITTLEQLRCAGVVAAVTISRSAYPAKLDIPIVQDKYHMLNENKKPGGYASVEEEAADICENLLKRFEKERKDGSIAKGYAVGKSRIYFKAGCLESLEAARALIWDKW